MYPYKTAFVTGAAHYMACSTDYAGRSPLRKVYSATVPMQVRQCEVLLRTLTCWLSPL